MVMAPSTQTHTQLTKRRAELGIEGIFEESCVGRQGKGSGSNSIIGMDIEEHEMMQSSMKKAKSEAVSMSTMERKERTTEKLRKMSIRERCLMMERAIYAEEELQEIPIEYHDLWDYTEDITESQS